MAKAKSKSKDKAKKKSGPKISKVVTQCTIYAQSSAAYQAGFYTDPTGDFDYAGCSVGATGRKHFDAADRALFELNVIALNDKATLSDIEMMAKTRVMNLLAKKSVGENFEQEEALYIRMFARDVEKYVQSKKDDLN